MGKLTIQNIAKILGIKKKGIKNAEINHLLTDSRILLSPSDTLFFAIVTNNNDGHKYIDDLYNLNVRYFVISQFREEWNEYKDATFLFVNNTIDALQQIAAQYRQKFSIPIVAITGSNGKTVVKEWLNHILFGSMNITRSPRSFNSQIGVPLSVWQLNEKTEIGIFEAGISTVGEMERLQNVLQPTIGVFTNLGQAHQEGFATLENKCLEKLELFANSEVIICNEDDLILEDCMSELGLSYKRFTWSTKLNENSKIQILQINKSLDKTQILFSILGMENKIEIPFSDNASIENAINVLTTCIFLRLPMEDIIPRFKTLESVAMRLDVRQGFNNCTIINDTYNSDINSLVIALDFLSQRATNNSQKKAIILSDIPQAGMETYEIYKKIADLLESKNINILIGIGDAMCTSSDLFKVQKRYFYSTTDEFIESKIYKEFDNTSILLKGARHFSFETISQLLELKNHETVMEINLDSIVHNYNFFRSKLKSQTKIICMVKADGYGGGAKEIAKTLQYHQADYLAVAVAEEGVELRKSGIRIPIIVLNSEVGGFDELFEYDLEPEVYNFRILNSFIKEARKRGANNYPIHLKVDTGMHRLGFSEDDLPKLLEVINQQQSLQIISVFSHLAASESWNFDEFTISQIESFMNISSKLQAGLPYKVLRHILNSAGIERFDKYQLDMVRLGISLYGISASGLQGLRQVHTLKTTILQIKKIKAGETVGYGRNGILEKDTTIATIRIGYADGLDRRLGNGKGYVMVNGKKAMYIGNICMDLCMIDITDIQNVAEGDYVTVMGERINIIEISNIIGTIPYEVLTSISNRVKQVYFKE